MRTPVTPLFLLVLFLFPVPFSAGAQEVPLLEPGALFRLKILEGHSIYQDLPDPQIGSDRLIVGTLRSVTDSLIVLYRMDSDAELTIPVAAIEKAQVHIGKKRNTLSGFGWGLLLGGAFGAGLGLSDGGRLSRNEGAALGALLFGVPAGIVGLVVGALTKSDRWEDVSVSGVKVSFQAGGSGRFRLGFRIPVSR